MSMHKSLKSTRGLTRTRNVLTREERLEKLMEDEEWDREKSVFGLPKVKVETVSLRRKAEEKETEEEGAEAAAEEEGAAETGSED